MQPLGFGVVTDRIAVLPISLDGIVVFDGAAGDNQIIVIEFLAAFQDDLLCLGIDTAHFSLLESGTVLFELGRCGDMNALDGFVFHGDLRQCRTLQ